MLDPLLALHTARLVLESDDHWGGAGTHPNYKNTQQYVSGLVAIVESHTGISAVSQLRGIAAAARPDSSSSSSSTPVCMASKQTLIETLQVGGPAVAVACVHGVTYREDELAPQVGDHMPHCYVGCLQSVNTQHMR